MQASITSLRSSATYWVVLMIMMSTLANNLAAGFASSTGHINFATTSSTSTKWELTKETNLVFYMRDWETGKNVTAIPIAGVHGAKSFSPLKFGTVVVIDDALTVGPERDSKRVGRAQGVYIQSALDGSDLHLLFSVVFTGDVEEGKYNGSTLEIQGADRFFLKQREVSVVSGTGAFRFARGFAVVETKYLDLPTLNAVLKFNVTVIHL